MYVNYISMYTKIKNKIPFITDFKNEIHRCKSKETFEGI